MRPEIYDAPAWEVFLKKLANIRAQGLVGDPLLEALELAWAPLFEGVDEQAAREVYAEVMFVVEREGIAAPDWDALS